MTAYHPSPDQIELAASMAASFAAILPLARLREARGEPAQAWDALRELGTFAIGVPEEHGGSGLGALEEALIVIELGRRAASPAVIASVGAALLQPTEGRVSAGYRRAGRVVFVDEPGAAHIFVRDAESAALFDAPSSSSLIDDHLWSSTLRQAGDLGQPLAQASGAQLLRLRLIDAAALAGIAGAALDMAVEYAGLREQFGRPIGSFQAVKHHCANMAMAARLACDQVSFAALALDERRDGAALQVESALYVAGAAAIECCSKNVQVHGGIGFSDEALPHHLLKRARVLLEIAGGLEAALVRVASAPAGRE